jgi:hypothetical protein
MVCFSERRFAFREQIQWVKPLISLGPKLDPRNAILRSVRKNKHLDQTAPETVENGRLRGRGAPKNKTEGRLCVFRALYP